MSTTMLYRCPGPHQIHGGQFDYVIVDDEQIEAKLDEGWHLTTPEAKAAHEEEQAAQLVASSGSTSDEAKPAATRGRAARG